MQPVYEPDERWVPADRRWCGLDRRTIVPALAVLCLAIVMTVVAPAVNSSFTYTEQVAPGDIMELADGVTFVPEPGWGITDGVRRGNEPASGYPNTATVVNGDASLSVGVVPFQGDADAALTQLEERVRRAEPDGAEATTGTRAPLTTDQGVQGRTVDLTDAVAHKVLAAFVIDGFAVKAVAIEPLLATSSDRDIANRMITSIRRDGEPDR